MDIVAIVVLFVVYVVYWTQFNVFNYGENIYTFLFILDIN